MKREENPWTQGIVMICTKCAKEGPSSENLKTYLKKSFKDTGDLSKIRIVTTSCLNVCEDGTTAVAYARTKGSTETFTMHPEKDREEMLNYLREQIKG